MKYRIVNRRRFIGFCIGVILLFSFAFSSLFRQAGAAAGTEEYMEITVSAGDTLWQLAEEFGSRDKDIREVIYDIRKINGMSSSCIYPGQTVKIPLQQRGEK